MGVKERLRVDHTSLTAAGVAFFGFLALIPALAAVISLYGLVADPDDVRTRMSEAFSTMPAEARDLLTDQLTRLTESSSASLGLGLVISIVIALWSASSGMAHLIEAISIAYGQEEGRGPVALRGMALALTFGVLVVVGVAVGGLGLARSIGEPGSALRWVIGVAGWLVAGALVVGVLSMLYRHGPDKDGAATRRVAPGAITALIGWLLITVAFGIYVSNFGSYGETYGSLASIVILLFFIYLTAFVVLVGAQLNAELGPIDDGSEGPPTPSLIDASS